MNLSGRVTVSGGHTKRSTTTPEYALGSAGQDRIGRVYRYCQAGIAPLVVGNVIQSAATIPAHTDMAPEVTAAGAVVVRVMPAGTAGAANLYADGIATISTAPGLAETYGISKHAAITASTAFDLYLHSDEPIGTALTTASRVDVRTHPYKAVIQAPITTLTGTVVGVAIYAIPAGEYGWLQTWGPCGVLNSGTTGAGLAVASPGSVAGGVVVATAGVPYLGDIMTVGVDGKAKLINLKIAP